MSQQKPASSLSGGSSWTTSVGAAASPLAGLSDDKPVIRVSARMHQAAEKELAERARGYRSTTSEDVLTRRGR